MPCPECGFSNEPGEAFCGGCGVALFNKRSTLEPERRQLTVMFCDLVGSTALAERLDPEDLREVIRAFQDVSTRVIARYEGMVSRFMGDGILVLFGYPRAHEDDAERAVRAGLGIVEAIAELNATPSHQIPEQLAVRVGIATGLVVAGDLIGEGAAEEEAVVGETPNLAARLQSLGQPNEVVIAPSTQRLVGELFEYEDLGSHEIGGLSEPVQIWRVIQQREVASRFEAVHTTELTPFVGREEELDALMCRWQQAKKGKGQVVQLSGEAGIGKSRITQTLCEHIAMEPHIRLRYQCSPYYTSSALYVVIRQLERAARFSREDSPERKLEKLEQLLAQSTTRIEELAPLFAALLSIPTSGRYPPLSMSPQRQKRKTIAAVFDQIHGLTERQPVLVIVEDVQWIDPSSHEVLDLLVKRAQGFRVLVVVTFRPEFVPTRTGQPHVTLLAMNRLNQKQSAAMVHRLMGDKALPPEVAEQIVVRTDGVPLFVEELTKTILDSGLLTEEADRYALNGPLASLAIPATLQDSLTARLDQLAPVKKVAQLAATLGRTFSHELLAAVSPLEENALDDALTQLGQAGLIYRRGLPPDIVYEFKHALVCDAAYESLLRSKRQQLHARIADVLESQFPETLKTRPELLAHHCTAARLAEKAADYWHQAGQRASERSANVEAVSHLEKGLEIVGTLSERLKREEKELTLLITLGAVLITTKGPGAAEVKDVYTRALELCSYLPESPLHFAAFWGQWRISGSEREARELADKLLDLAQRQKDTDLLLQAQHAQWPTLFCLGELVACREHIKAGVALYNPREHRSHASLYGGHDTKVCCQAHDAVVLWLLGFPEQALEHADDATTLARQLHHSASLAHALDYDLMLSQCLREPREVVERAEKAISLSTEQDFPDYLARALVFRGWALAQLGEKERGIADIREGIASQRDTGTREDFPIFLDMLAEACGVIARPAEAKSVLDEALTMADDSNRRHWEAELHRHKGELLLSVSDENDSEAKTCFRKAIDIARLQSAKSLELRAAMSLARLKQRQGRRRKAHDGLAPVYAWFTEGFDTNDLKEAKALLEELCTVQV